MTNSIPSTTDADARALEMFNLQTRACLEQPVSFFGRIPHMPSDRMRLTLDQVMAEIETQTGGRIAKQHLLSSRFNHPLCKFQGDFVVLPDSIMHLSHPRDRSGQCCDSPVTVDQNRAFITRRWQRPEPDLLSPAGSSRSAPITCQAGSKKKNPHDFPHPLLDSPKNRSGCPAVPRHPGEVAAGAAPAGNPLRPGKSRFYRDHLAHVDPGAVTRREDLAGIPFTFPGDIVEQGTRMVCISAGEISRITTLLTSGSQGPPKRICFTRKDMDRTIDFFACGMSTLVTPKNRVLICMSSGAPDSIGDLLQQGLSRIGVSSLIYGNIRDPDQAAGRAGEFDCLVGLPAEMLYLARTAPGLRPATALLSADYVPDSIIQVLESTWQCRVFTHYGMTETGYGGGVQCGARQAYHLRDADLLVEIVDPDTGTPLPPERTGEVILTTLQNEAMPLIRYRTGDLAKMAADPCPPAPLMENGCSPWIYSPVGCGGGSVNNPPLFDAEKQEYTVFP